MGFLSVIAAAIAAYAFGAVWYMALGKRWMAAVGLTEEEVNRKDFRPYVVAFVSALIVAGMTRHVFVMSGIDTLANGIMGGVGLGLFIAAPWIVNNYFFAGRPRDLIWIDGLYAAIGCTIIGIVLTLF